ncbi:MAG: hypothetical protein IK064_07105 [Clostridia bacterium]|nr:hypothetical protein [Clostridia bacterium]
MKRTTALFLILCLCLPLICCAKTDAPVPTSLPEGVTAAPVSTDPDATPGPYVPGPFDPETDYDNRYAAIFDCAIVDTEEAYYFYRDGFIRYYDKIMEEEGYLCPKPECQHGDKRPNPDCNASAEVNAGSLTYYEGQLWWVGDKNNGRSYAIYRMNLDGTEKTLVHEFQYEESSRGMIQYFFHRGRIYWSRMDQEISGADAFDTATFGYIGLDDFENHVLFERRSFINPQPTIRFAGESAYFFVSYDSLEPGAEIPDGETDYEAYVAFLKEHPQTDEILRIDPSMDEPETVYLDTEDGEHWGFYGFGVAQDGTIYFRRGAGLEDPEQPFEYGVNEYVHQIYKVGADGKKEFVLELTDPDGNHYFPVFMDGNLILGIDAEWAGLKGYLIHGVWLLDYSGNTYYRGELTVDYRERYPGFKHNLADYDSCWATETELMFCFAEWFDGTGAHGSDMRYYDLVKYEITPDGLVEKHLIHCRMHFLSDDDTIVDY